VKASGKTFSATSRFSFVSRAIDLAHAAGLKGGEDLVRAEVDAGL
jgi:hypothetical protein